VAKPKWGVKRFCGGCGARFYDMGRNPIICPKCGAPHDPVGQAKSQRSKPAATAAKPETQPVPVATDVAVAKPGGDANDLLIDGGEDSDEAAESEEAIEDASELGEDKDDMLEVIDNVEGDKEPDS